MRLFRIFICVFTLSLVIPQMAHATEWVTYKDQDGLFSVLLPENFKINKTMFRVSENEVLAGTEVTANIDQRPFKNSLKQFIIRADHTFAFPPNEKEISGLWEIESKKYTDFYEAQGGKVLEKKLGVFAGHQGIEIAITYKDKKFGEQIVQSRIIFSDFSRFEQIAIGPMDAFFKNETKNFFSSLQLNKGRTALKGSFENEWKKITSPFNMTTVLVPGITKPFIMEDPAFITSDKIERLTLKIKDPLFGSTLFYSIYGYRLDKLITSENLQQLVMDRHLKKFKIDIRTLKFSKSSYGKIPVLSTQLKFPRPKKFPYMDTIQINAFYFGNFVVVQELVGSEAHVLSPFAKRLKTFFEFHPFKAHSEYEKEKVEKSEKSSVQAEPVKAEAPQDPIKPNESETVKKTPDKPKPAVQ